MVEVAVKEQNDIYWFARVVTVSGQLLGLCYVNSLDFLQPQEEGKLFDSVGSRFSASKLQGTVEFCLKLI